MYFDVSLRSSCLEVESCEVRRFGSGRIDFGELLRRCAMLFRTSEPDEIREFDTSTKEVVASVDTKNCAKSVFKIILQTVRSCDRKKGIQHTRLAGSRLTRSISNHVRQNTREIHMQ